MRTRRSRRGDRGVVLVLFALTIAFLLLLVAFAVDLGQVRSSRREAQATSDLAALDAGFFLSGRGSPSATSEPQRACRAAARAVERNISGFGAISTATLTSQCASFPLNRAACVASTPNTAQFTGGDYRLIITYPVPADQLAPIGATGVGVNDGTDACERLSVEVRKREDTTFAKVAGFDELRTRAVAVVRVFDLPPGGDPAPPAFLLLERTDCGVLGNSVGGAGNQGIVVEGNGASPGFIHVDSDATTNCSGTTQSAYAIYGATLSNGQPSITAQSAQTGGRTGVISSRATNGRGAAVFPGGLSVAPVTATTPVSRRGLDRRYNEDSNTAISDLHTAASAAVRAIGAPAGSTTMGCTGPAPAAAHIYVNCPAFNASITFPASTTRVTFSGSVDLKQSNALVFLGATDIVVRGQLAVPQGSVAAPVVERFFVGGGVTVSNGSSLAVNTGTVSTCPDAWTRTTRFAIFGGSPALDIAGSAAFCHTTVYLAGPITLTSYAIQQTISGGTCSTDLPCPKRTGNVATGARFAVSGTVVWTAPNRYPTSEPPSRGVEDLAFWSEGAGVSDVKSGGVLRTTGVFVGPNADYEMRSPATGSPRDAQFIGRSLFLFQGTLRMRPSPTNSFTTPLPGNYGLIR